MNRKPRIRSILFCVNLGILLLPLASIGVLRLFENALLQQTESELTAQAAFVKAAFKSSLHRQSNALPSAFDITDYGIKLPPDINNETAQWQPLPPKLDLANDEILPPAPEPINATSIVLPAIRAAGVEITKIMRDAQQTTLAAIRVVDVNAVVIASTGGDLYQSLENHIEVETALQGQFQSILRQRVSDKPIPPLESISRGARIRVFQAMPIIDNGYLLGAVLLSRTPQNLGQLLYKHRQALVVAVIVVFGAVLAITIVSVITLVGPIERVTRQAKQFTTGESGPFIPLKNPVTHEVSELSNAVVQMAEHLDARARYIQDFAAQVSHAFKTPLTAMRGAIELLQDHLLDMSSEERDKFLSNLSKDANYLQNLVQRLLELARADTIQPDNSATLISPLLLKLVESGRQRGLDIVINLNTENLTTAMSANLLESILLNLIENASQHGGDRVVIDAVQSASKLCTVTVSDNGKGISSANAAKVFEPFFTTTRHIGGSGLGLAVSRSLLRAHHGDIMLLESNSGASFEIRLPVFS